MVAVAWFDLPARSYYGSIEQVRSASTSLVQFNWLRRNACIRAAHEACALDAYSLVFPVNTLPVISRHTVLICILTPMPGPYWTTTGLVLVAHRVPFLPSLPTILSGSVKIPSTHFAISQLTLRNPSHPPPSCVAMTPHDLRNSSLRTRMPLSSWTHFKMRLPHQVDLQNAKRAHDFIHLSSRRPLGRQARSGMETTAIAMGC
jgi:hypothetical protein